MAPEEVAEATQTVAMALAPIRLRMAFCQPLNRAHFSKYRMARRLVVYRVVSRQRMTAKFSNSEKLLTNRASLPPSSKTALSPPDA